VGIINLAFVPLYIKFMGVEGFALVGFYLTLQSLLVLFDFGLSTTANRELARYSSLLGQEQKMRNITRTLEIVYWSIAVMIGVGLLLLSPLIGSYWLKADTLSGDTVQKVILKMGLAIAFQFPANLYTGCFMGLQRQVLYNGLNAAIWTIRGVGAALVVSFSANPVVDFFNWQLFASILNATVLAIMLWRTLPASPEPARFQKRVLYSVWRFAAGISGISVTVLLFNQLDKVILSKLLSLTMFGYYSLAWQIIGALFILYFPLYAVFFPVFTQHVTRGDVEGLKHAYHRSCQLMSVVILPVVLVIALFARDILLIWTGNITVASNAHGLVSILIIGAAFNALLYMPFTIQQAYGYTKYGVYAYLGALIIFIPLIFFFATTYGAVGGALVWASLNAILFLATIPFTHKRFLPGENRRWCVEDVGRPLFAALAIVGTARLFINGTVSGPAIIATVAGVLFLSVLAAACAVPTTFLAIKRVVFQKLLPEETRK
jgi:O-antigen/teichoic acid export membrane protein